MGVAVGALTTLAVGVADGGMSIFIGVDSAWLVGGVMTSRSPAARSATICVRAGSQAAKTSATAARSSSGSSHHAFSRRDWLAARMGGSGVFTGMTGAGRPQA